jgi:hypothetical protein
MEGFELPSRPGVKVIKKGVFVYRCLMCGRRETYDDAYGPACTGPGAVDVHPMEPMELVGREEPKLYIIGR